MYQFDYAQTRGQFAYYFPTTQRGVGAVQAIALRTAVDPATVLPLLREQVRALDPEQSIWKLDTASTAYARFFALPRFYTSLMGALAGLGIVIAAVGLYGVLTYAIAQQTREFGIRLALGAQKRDILRMVLRGGAVVTGLGLLAGAARQRLRDPVARIDAGRCAATGPCRIRRRRPTADARRASRVLDPGEPCDARRSRRCATGRLSDSLQSTADCRLDCRLSTDD